MELEIFSLREESSTSMRELLLRVSLVAALPQKILPPDPKAKAGYSLLHLR